MKKDSTNSLLHQLNLSKDRAMKIASGTLDYAEFQPRAILSTGLNERLGETEKDRRCCTASS